MYRLFFFFLLLFLLTFSTPYFQLTVGCQCCLCLFNRCLREARFLSALSLFSHRAKSEGSFSYVSVLSFVKYSKHPQDSSSCLVVSENVTLKLSTETRLNKSVILSLKRIILAVRSWFFVLNGSHLLDLQDPAHKFCCFPKVHGLFFSFPATIVEI